MFTQPNWRCSMCLQSDLLKYIVILLPNESATSICWLTLPYTSSVSTPISLILTFAIDLNVILECYIFYPVRELHKNINYLFVSHNGTCLHLLEDTSGWSFLEMLATTGNELLWLSSQLHRYWQWSPMYDQALLAGILDQHARVVHRVFQGSTKC